MKRNPILTTLSVLAVWLALAVVGVAVDACRPPSDHCAARATQCRAGNPWMCTPAPSSYWLQTMTCPAASQCCLTTTESGRQAHACAAQADCLPEPDAQTDDAAGDAHAQD